MPHYKLTKIQAFWRILLLNFVLEAIPFAGVMWFYDLTRVQLILLVIVALLIYFGFAVKAWNSPAMND